MALPSSSSGAHPTGETVAGGERDQALEDDAEKTVVEKGGVPTDAASTVSHYDDARDDEDHGSVLSNKSQHDNGNGTRKKEFPTSAMQLFYTLDELLGQGEVAADAGHRSGRAAGGTSDGDG